MYDQKINRISTASICFLKRISPLLILVFFISCTTFKSQDQTPPDGPSVSLVTFFQEYISPVDGDRCRMQPSCSEYSLESIRKHGMLKGWVMTCDRLMRCGRDELNQAPPSIMNGKKYCFDPVTHNDFWWAEESQCRPESP